jgi:enoyl-[acyl-carrier protein] reductase III
MNSSLRLDGRVALVTGGTRGLGRAVAAKLVASGCDVYLNYAHDQDAAERTAKDLAGLGSGTVSLCRGDVTAAGTVPALVAPITERHGGLDVFVHNVASFHPMQATAANVADLHTDLATALDPLLYGAATLRSALAGRPGRVIAVSSTGAHRVVPRYTAPGLAKAALESLVRYLAAELAADGICVNAVSTAKLDKGPQTPDQATLARLAALTPAGRVTRPEDVADVVALLCTDEAAWIHGQVLCADGGLGLRG